MAEPATIDYLVQMLQKMEQNMNQKMDSLESSMKLDMRSMENSINSNNLKFDSKLLSMEESLELNKATTDASIFGMTMSVQAEILAVKKDADDSSLTKQSMSGELDSMSQRFKDVEPKSSSKFDSSFDDLPVLYEGSQSPQAQQKSSLPTTPRLSGRKPNFLFHNSLNVSQSCAQMNLDSELQTADVTYEHV